MVHSKTAKRRIDLLKGGKKCGDVGWSSEVLYYDRPRPAGLKKGLYGAGRSSPGAVQEAGSQVVQTIQAWVL